MNYKHICVDKSTKKTSKTRRRKLVKFGGNLVKLNNKNSSKTKELKMVKLGKII